MRFYAAGVGYQLIIPNAPLLDDQGEEIEGRAVEEQAVILISRRVEPERRYEVLVHELTHCWAFAGATPATEEDRCRLNATMMRQLQADLTRQGGETALMDLKPQPFELNQFKRKSVESLRELSAPQPYWLCGGCEARVMCGDIHQGEIVYLPGSREHYVKRWMQCEACGAVTTWCEYCDEVGNVTGRLVQVPKPEVYRGDHARAWLRSIEAAAG